MASCSCSHDVAQHDATTQACVVCFCSSWTLCLPRALAKWQQPRTYAPRPVSA